MNLTVREQSVIDNLPEHIKQFVVARNDTPLKFLTPNQVKKGISEILCQASFDMGSPMSTDLKILQFQTEACFNEFNFKYSSLTLPEVKNAFKMGIRGEFGQYFGLCPKTYHQFIKSYYELPERFKANNEYLKQVGAQESKEVGRDQPPNPEGIKKVIDILKPFAESKKPPYQSEKSKIRVIERSPKDVFINECFKEHYKIWLKKPAKDIDGKPLQGRFIMFEGQIVDELEYAQIKLKTWTA